MQRISGESEGTEDLKRHEQSIFPIYEEMFTNPQLFGAA